MHDIQLDIVSFLTSHFIKLQTTTKITTSGDGCHCIHYAHQPGLCLGQGSVTLGQNTEKNDR